MTQPVKITVSAVGTGLCALSGKEDADGLTVSFDDQTVVQQHLSWKSFRQLVAMKIAQASATTPTVQKPVPPIPRPVPTAIAAQPAQAIPATPTPPTTK